MTNSEIKSPFVEVRPEDIGVLEFTATRLFSRVANLSDGGNKQAYEDSLETAIVCESLYKQIMHLNLNDGDTAQLKLTETETVKLAQARQDVEDRKRRASTRFGQIVNFATY